MRGLVPNRSLNLRLSIRASPRVTMRMVRSLAEKESVLAICPGFTPCASAARTTVAVLVGSSITSISGALAAKNAFTESRLIASHLLILIIVLMFKSQYGQGQARSLPCGVMTMNFYQIEVSNCNNAEKRWTEGRRGGGS